MIHQVLMGLGDSSITLKADTPRDVRQTPVRGDHLIITTGRLFDSDITASVLKAQAIYSMRIDRIENDDLTFSGPSIMAWIGDGDNPSKGFISSIGFGGVAPYTVTTLVNALTWPANGISKGSNFGSSPVSVNDTFVNLTTRAALNRWCRITGDEYRVNADGSLDWGAPDSSTFWRFASSMTLLLMEGAAGRDLDGIDGMPVTRFEVSKSGADFINFSAAQDDALTTVDTGVGTVRGGFTAATTLVGQFEGGIPTGSTVDRANTMITKGVDQEIITVSIDPKVEHVASYFTKNQPGDYVYVYNEERRLIDLSNQLPYRGALVHPRSDLRVLEMKTPVTRSNGVYLYPTEYHQHGVAAGTAPIVDWADYVEFETAGAELVLGKRSQLSLRDAIAA